MTVSWAGKFNGFCGILNSKDPFLSLFPEEGRRKSWSKEIRNRSWRRWCWFPLVSFSLFKSFSTCFHLWFDSSLQSDRMRRVERKRGRERRKATIRGLNFTKKRCNIFWRRKRRWKKTCCTSSPWCPINGSWKHDSYSIGISRIRAAGESSRNR